MGLFGAINSLIQGNKQKKMAGRINPVNAVAEVNQPIQNLYHEGRNLYQGKAYGQNAAEQGLLTQNANFNENVNKNATSGSQAIATMAGALGSTNQGFVDLSTNAGQEKTNRFGINSQVSQLMSREQDKVYNDKLRNYYDDLNYKRGLEGASMQNKAGFFGGLDDLVNTGVSLLSPGGAFGGLLGGKKAAAGGGMSNNIGGTPMYGANPNYDYFNPNR